MNNLAKKVIVGVAAALAALAAPVSGSEPATTTSVIVQGDDVAALRALVAGAGGEVTHELAIIRAVAAEVAPQQLAALARAPKVRRIHHNHGVATAGIGTTSLYRLVLLLAVPVSLVTVWLTVFLSPSISYLTKRIQLEQKDAVIVAAMDAGRFMESNRGDIVLYAESSNDDKSVLNNLFVQQRQGGRVAIAAAARGHHRRDEETGLRIVTLEDGIRYEGPIRTPELTVLEFGEYSMWINPTDTGDLRKRYATWAVSALWNEDSLNASAELQKRLSHPLSLLAFALLAVPLSRSMPREGVYGRVLAAVLAYLVAAGLTQVAGTWMVKEVTPAWMGTWWVPTLMVLLALYLARRDLGRRARRRRRAT